MVHFASQTIRRRRSGDTCHVPMPAPGSRHNIRLAIWYLHVMRHVHLDEARGGFHYTYKALVPAPFLHAKNIRPEWGGLTLMGWEASHDRWNGGGGEGDMPTAQHFSLPGREIQWEKIRAYILSVIFPPIFKGCTLQ